MALDSQMCSGWVGCRVLRVLFQVSSAETGVSSLAVSPGRCIYMLRSCWSGVWPWLWDWLASCPLPDKLGSKGRGVRGKK